MGNQLEMGVSKFKRTLNQEELTTDQLEQVKLWLGQGLWAEQGGSISQYEHHVRKVLDKIEKADFYRGQLKIAYQMLLEENKKENPSKELTLTPEEQSDLFISAECHIRRNEDLFSEIYEFANADLISDTSLPQAISCISIHQTDRRMETVWGDMMMRRNLDSPDQERWNPNGNGQIQGYKGSCLMPQNGTNTISLEEVTEGFNKLRGDGAFVKMSPYIMREIIHSARVVGDTRVLQDREVVIQAIPQEYRNDVRKALDSK
ncbi:hypothetical protein CMI48_04245 [Candidatus Pacearchaeota archaeon]|nr:hypothetical protein [Candidatus Pacearchaeota archaeon]